MQMEKIVLLPTIYYKALSTCGCVRALSMDIRIVPRSQISTYLNLTPSTRSFAAMATELAKD